MERFIYETPEALGRGAAELFRALSEEEIRKRGLFTAVLPGGSTPQVLFKILSSEFKDKIPWKRVHFFWGDERCVPPESPESNYSGACKTLLSRIAIPHENIHRIKGELDPVEGAMAYEKEIRRFFAASMKAPGDVPVFDLVLLGIGEDGHTLSLFPGSKALDEKERLVAENYVQELRAWRITMTLPLVINASNTVFLVSGGKKAGILKEVLNDTGEARYPAQMIKPVKGRLTLLADKAAAGVLRLKR